MAEDIGMLSGLAQAGSSFLSAYRGEQDRQLRIKQYEDEIEAKKQAREDAKLNLQAGLMDKGLMTTPEGNLQFTPEAQKERQLKQGLLESQSAENMAKAKLYAGNAGAGGAPTKQQNQTFDKVQQILESNRGNPATSQAERDIYAAQKFESLANLYGDPNKLNPQQIQLAAAEVSKIAAGGVPTQHELQGLNPNTIPKSLASIAQTFQNSPSPANAGAFVNALKDYTSALKKDAQKVIEDKYGRVLESNKERLGDKGYNSLRGQYIDRFNKSEGGLIKQPGLIPATTDNAHPMDEAAVLWARQNPKDPRSAAILKANGVE